MHNTDPITREEMRRIMACVTACYGLPDVNGTISIVADMKAAILSNDPTLLKLVRDRLVEIMKDGKA